eukprot:6742865-Ditylum_brightwellii.AAC.1
MAPIGKYVGKKITREMWKGKVAAWRKSTTTSPSGHHLGHFKALIWCFAEDPNTDEGKDHQYSFKRWQNKVNIVIAKLLGLLQQQNRGNFSIKDYMGGGRNMMQKHSR